MADVTEVTGMILSSMPVGEYDRRIVILTRQLGKICAFAKGARRPNSPLIGVTRPFILGTFEVYRGRDSYTVYKAHADNYFEEAVSDLDAVWYGYYMAEVADYYGRENLDGSEMINLLYVSLKALSNPNISNELVRYIFELRIIAINGECPDFFSCHKCGKDKDIDTYSFSGNCVYCSNCCKGVNDGIKLSPSTLYALQFIVSSPLNKLYTFVLNEEVMSELRMVVGRIEAVTFDKKFKSKELMLENQKRND